MKILTDRFIDALLIKKARKNLSSKELSKMVNVNRYTISKIINYKIEVVQERTFDKLNDWLLEEETK